MEDEGFTCFYRAICWSILRFNDRKNVSEKSYIWTNKQSLWFIVMLIYRTVSVDESVRKGLEEREGSIRRFEGMTINPSFVRHGEMPLRFLPLISRINTATEYTPACLIRHCLLKGFLVERLAVSRCGYYSINGTYRFIFATKKRATKMARARNKNGKSSIGKELGVSTWKLFKLKGIKYKEISFDLLIYRI